MTKLCKTCGETKSITEFNGRSNRDDYHYKCRSCQKEYYKNYYNKSPKEKDRLRKLTIKSRLEMSTFINSLKDKPCTDCNVKYHPCAMDFDHLDEKEFNISRGGRSVSRKRLLLEISKCEVVCSNCHRVRTYNRTHSTLVNN